MSSDKWSDLGGVATDTGKVDQHDPRCAEGWLGEDSLGRPIPCLDCRPHLRNGYVR